MMKPFNKNAVLSLCHVFFIIIFAADAFVWAFSTQQNILFHQNAASTTNKTTRKKALHATAANHHDDEESRTTCSGKFLETPLLVPRISVNEFDPTKAVDRPILLSNAMSAKQCDACLDILMAQAGDIMIQVQQQTYSSSSVDDEPSIMTEVFQCTLHKAIDVIMTRSNSKQAYLAFCEGLLQQTPELLKMQDHVTSAREHAFLNSGSGSGGGGDGSHVHHDWFSQFPIRAQPTDAVIIAGAGATSTLHRDPFEWTGTSLCLEGTKVWRFIEPSIPHGVKNVDQQLNSYRLESIAWHDDDIDIDDGASSSMSLSAGWQSDYSLYHSRRHDSIPSARELAELAETDPSQYENLLKELAIDMDILRPSDAAQNLVIHTAIQKPGDLLLIPAHWWHQTYALEPSVAVASQRCSALDAPRVFEHILHQVTSKKNSERRQRRQEESILDIKSAVSSILNTASTSQEAIDELFRIVQKYSTKVGYNAKD